MLFRSQSIIEWKNADRALQGLAPLFRLGSLVEDPGWAESWWPMIPFVLMALLLYVIGSRKPKAA